MNKREKLSGVLVLAGIFLTATDSIPTVLTAMTLIGTGVVLANWPEIRACVFVRTKKRPVERKLRRSKSTYSKKYYSR